MVWEGSNPCPTACVSDTLATEPHRQYIYIYIYIYLYIYSIEYLLRIYRCKLEFINPLEIVHVVLVSEVAVLTGSVIRVERVVPYYVESYVG